MLRMILLLSILFYIHILLLLNSNIIQVSPNMSQTRPTGGDSLCSAPFLYAMTSGICQAEFANILTSSNCQVDSENFFVIRNEEARVSQLISGLTTFGSSIECRNKALPFLCLQLFGLCGSAQILIQPTRNECEEIRDMLCPQEWNTIMQFGIDLPDCARLPPETPTCPALNDSNSTNEIFPGNGIL